MRSFTIIAILGAILGLTAVLTGCYDTPQPECAFLCGAGDSCPEGYACAGDGWCKRPDIAQDFQCAPPVPDAAVDASIADAGPDGGPDGGDAAVIDAGPADAAPDGAADAAADAAPVTTPDATVDAMPAAMVDAMPDAT